MEADSTLSPLCSTEWPFLPGVTTPALPALSWSPHLSSVFAVFSPSQEIDEPGAADVVEELDSVEPEEDMATSLGTSSGDARRGVVSPRPKGRENTKINTLCRNIGIYGHCRFEHEGCLYNHDVGGSGKSNAFENRFVSVGPTPVLASDLRTFVGV